MRVLQSNEAHHCMAEEENVSGDLQAIRGMNDILPEETPRWQLLETVSKRVLSAYGYAEIRIPIMENSALFARSIGDATDIVEKEMYTFADRNGDSVSLRPEGTAGCVRAGIEHGLLYNQIQRFWYSGPMFRHERPQKGRYRQFHQIGAEVFGLQGPDIDAELILMTARLWRELGIDGVALQINTLGAADARAEYRSHLIEYFNAHRADLDADSLRRLERNPLRILDSKNPEMAELVAQAPLFDQHLDVPSREHFEQLSTLLRDAGLAFEVNPRLVRGLDYYNRTVFEWVTDRLGAQGTVCGGGRYDGLVEHFGAQSTPAVGFAMGLERLVALLDSNAQGDRRAADIYVIPLDTANSGDALQVAEQLRNHFPQLRIQMHCGAGSIKNRFKLANRSGADFAIVLGDEEKQQNSVTLKPLSDAQEQQRIPRETLVQSLSPMLAALGLNTGN